MADSEPSAVPTQEQLQGLADRLRREYEPRFHAANIDLSIGRMRWPVTRGIGMEILGDWYSFDAARWSLFTRRWIPVTGLEELEEAVRGFLEEKLAAASH